MNTSTITRQSLLHKLNNDTELFDECDYLDLTDSQTLDIKDCDLNLLHLNVRGIISKQSKLVRLLQDCIGRHTIHVVTLNETWLTKDNEHYLNVPDYHVVKRNRMGKKGGGVCILIHKSLNYKEIDTINALKFAKGFIRLVACVGSGDPVRVLRLYTTITLDEVCSIYC